MTWHAQLNLQYLHSSAGTVVHHQHEGPLRLLQSLYPEGTSICHNVLVHPPGGLVGGDHLNIQIEVAPQCHGLITTPGATRFYRSEGPVASQVVHARLSAGARLEWLPLESIAYQDCHAENQLKVDVAQGAEFLGWDITALGLPAAQQPFTKGHFLQHIEVPGIWLEKGHLDAQDHRLMDSPLGLAGHRCMGTLFFVAGQAIDRDRKEHALEHLREAARGHTLHACVGVTSPNSRVLLVRVLGPWVEPVMGLMRLLRGVCRQTLWGLEPHTPRIWST